MWGAGWPQDRDRARPGRCLRTITADRSTGCCGPRSAPDRAWPSPCTVRSRPGRHGIQLESDPHLVLPPQHPAHDPRAGRPGPQPGPPRRSRRPPAGFDREAYRHRTVGEVVLCIDAAAVWWMWAVGLGRGRHRIRATTSVEPRPRAERRRRSGATAPLSPRACPRAWKSGRENEWERGDRCRRRQDADRRCRAAPPPHARAGSDRTQPQSDLSHSTRPLGGLPCASYDDQTVIPLPSRFVRYQSDVVSSLWRWIGQPY